MEGKHACSALLVLSLVLKMNMSHDLCNRAVVVDNVEIEASLVTLGYFAFICPQILPVGCLGIEYKCSSLLSQIVCHVRISM